MSGLSDEQRRRLEENRRKALAIRAAKQQQQQQQRPPPPQQQQPHKPQQQLQNRPQQQQRPPPQQPHKPQQQLQNRPPQPQHRPQQYQQQRPPPPQQQTYQYHPQQQQQKQVHYKPQQQPQQQLQNRPPHPQQQRPPPPQQQSNHPDQQQNSFSLQPLAPQSKPSSIIGPPTVTRTTNHIKHIPLPNPNPTHTPFQPTPSHPTGSTQPSFYKTKASTAAFSTYGSKPNQRDGFRSGAGQERGKQFDKFGGQSSTSVPATTRPGHAITKGTCVLVSRTRFEVQVGYMNALIDLFKTMETKQYNPQTKCWSFDLQEYDKLKKAVAAAFSGTVQLQELPHPVVHTFKKRIRGKAEEADARRVPTADLCHVDECLVDALLPFQRQGVNFALWKQGRLLLADDMGLGKTLQAICVACYYREQWPLLIVVPSSVRFAWRAQLLRWVPSLDPQDINVITTAKDHMTGGEVTIVSYDLLVRSKVLQARHFDVVIMDECHLLKNNKTARTKAALPIIKRAARVLLLSGTPALSRPSELYTQISAIDHRAFPNYHNYGVRYCEGKQHQWGWDYTGSSHMEELQIVLQENIMIRRLKKDVLSQLPPKRREMIVLNPSNVKGSKFMKAKHQQVDNLKGMERRGALLEYFHETGSCKGPAVKEYVLDLLEADHKFLFFGHHQEMLDCVEEAVRKHKYGFIRIDGKTSGDQRNQLVEDFQKRDDIKVALLSIMAANAGINLTAASLVVFGELFWNPGILVQAEDRVHRIGQEDSVNIRYLVATGTADDYIWPLVQQKLNVLGKAGLSKDDFSNADTTHMKDPKQPDMMSFFEQSFFESVDWEEDTDSWAPPDNTRPRARAEFVENPSPKKKTPRKRAAPSTPSKLKQRTIFKFLSPTKQGPAGDAQVAQPSTPNTAKSSLFTYFTPVKEGEAGGTEEGVLGKGESSGGAEGTQMTAAVFDDWDDEITDSLLQDVDFDEPPAKRGRHEQYE